MFEEFYMNGAEMAVVAYGTAARIAKAAVKRCAEKNMRVGLIRPISLWPYPYAPIRAAASRVRFFLVPEMSLGQMIEDVRLALQGLAQIGFHGRPGGVVPTPVELANVVMRQYDRKEGIIDPVT